MVSEDCDIFDIYNYCQNNLSLSTSFSANFVLQPQCYFIGWNRKYVLEIYENSQFLYHEANGCSYSLMIKGYNDQVNSYTQDFNTHTLFHFHTSEDVINTGEYSIKVIDYDEHGRRWEGWCLGDVPFGYGMEFDENNDLIYKGFLFGKKKFGYGEEYYGSSRLLRFQGTYINGERFGIGFLYNTEGGVEYKGEWAFDNNDISVIQVSNETNDDKIIHNLVQRLTIGNNCYTDLKDLIITKFPNLCEFIVGADCFLNVDTLKIAHCNNLMVVDIGNNSFCNVREFIVECNVDNIIIHMVFLN